MCARREKYCGELHIVFGAHSEIVLLYSFARPVWRRQAEARRACVYGRRKRAELDSNSVVHGEVEYLCTSARRHRDWW